MRAYDSESSFRVYCVLVARVSSVKFGIKDSLGLRAAGRVTDRSEQGQGSRVHDEGQAPAPLRHVSHGRALLPRQVPQEGEDYEPGVQAGEGGESGLGCRVQGARCGV